MTQPEPSTSKRPEAVRIWLLGGFSVSVGSRLVRQDEWRSKKAATLVKLLALAPGHRMHREQVIALFWPGSARSGASNNLRQVLHRARKVLDPASGTPGRYVSLADEVLVLCPEGPLWVDSDAFEEAASIARRSRDLAAYRAAIDLYSGELLLEDRYEEWAESRRAEFRQLYLALITELAGLYEVRGEYAPAVEVLGKATAVEPTLEEAHASIMRLHALSGRPERALAQYERLREALHSGLGTEPSSSTHHLREEISVGRLPTVPPADPARGQPSDGVKHNIPAAMTSFVGREREMVEIKRTLAMTRLLTLTGAGGTGKTRLALEIARDLAGAYADGVWLVELASLSEPGLVIQEVANDLGVQERSGEPITATLVEALAAREMLLVIDNCEHLVEEAARLADVLLASCPRLKVLATSREPLGVSGEVVWAVSPLSLPDPTNGEAIADALMRYEAVRLFIDRARLRLLDFKVTQENAGAVARVCRKLDGIPLAIELATARMGALAVEQIAQRLEVSLDVLKGTSRSAAPRQQTLRATLDWSNKLLSEDERTFFSRLSVFAGGWTLEAAEAVCSGDCIGREDVLDLLGGLVDKSLVVAVAAAGGAARYMMLEPIRQYAREKLDKTEEREQVRHQHAEFYLALAEEAERELNGPDRLACLERLRSEHDNMRMALSYALERKEAELALRLAGAVRSDWSGFSEVCGWLEAAIAISERASIPARLRALSHLKWLSFWQGDFARAEAAAVESLDLSRQTGETQEVLESLRLLADVTIQDSGDYRRATKLYEEGIALCREHGYTGELAQYLADMAEGAMYRGDLRRAEELLQEAALLLRGKEHGIHLEFVLEVQGWVALLQGEREQAKSFHVEGLALCRRVNNTFIATSNIEGLACIDATCGEDERAARLFGAAQKLHETVGDLATPAERALREPYLTAARARLDKAAWEAAFAQGRAMTFGEAVEYALTEGEPGSSTSPVLERVPTDEAVSSLTRREWEVAILVSQGYTNRQIAQELSISERTVANHVAKILRKLRFRSRAQIASWTTESQPSVANRN